MFVEGVKDSLYHVKDMIMKVTPAVINSNWIQKDYHHLLSEGGHASQQGFAVYRKTLI